MAALLLVLVLPITAGAPPPVPMCYSPDGHVIMAHGDAALTCRDGEPRCDLDGRCDGECIMAYCLDNAACTPPAAAFCAQAALARPDVHQAEIEAVVSGAQDQFIVQGDVFIDSLFTLRCRPGRSRCRRKGHCTMHVTGAVRAVTKRCNVWAENTYVGPSLFVYLWAKTARATLAGNLYLGNAAPGPHALGDGLTTFGMTMSTPRQNYLASGASYEPAATVGSVAFDLSADVPAGTYAEPRGTLAATLEERGGTAPVRVEMRF